MLRALCSWQKGDTGGNPRNRESKRKGVGTWGASTHRGLGNVESAEVRRPGQELPEGALFLPRRVRVHQP